MKISENEKIYGFTVKRVRESEELGGTFIEMSHDKTGAALCFMDNKAQNKLFSVSFKTLPKDSTGVFHILEHSVLCGSEKYPVKEPFVELLKSSMNTYLNAMTFPDKTVYPVSSRNERDFLNLTSVYLDAVFAPRLEKDPNIFFQEGIHIETDGEKPYYKGVVFNEMKGAMSGVDDRIEEGICSLLFPDNCYKYNSGGDPAVIPELTYEQFKASYREFYHPSNAKFFLDGDIPLEKTLQMIDSYLGKYERRDEEPKISLQAPVSGEKTLCYEISEGEKCEGKTILAFAKILGTWKERGKILAARILCDALADSNESPLKRAVLSSGLAEDLEMSVSDGIAQPYLLITVRNTDDKNCGEIKDIIRKTAMQLIKNGIDKNALSACINRFAFHAKQPPEPQGLYRAVASLQSWLYGDDPISYMLYNNAIEELRQMVSGDGFEKLLSELLLNDDGLVLLHMLPSKDIGKEERDAEEEKLEAELSKLTEEDIEKLHRQNEELCLWQSSPDTKEASASLPRLSICELNDSPDYISTETKTENGATLLYHRIPSNGIVYLSMYFPLTGFDLGELTALSVFPSFYGDLPTENYTVSELQQNIKTYIGNLSFSIGVSAKKDDTSKCTPCLEVHAGILSENLEKAKGLILEILTKTKFEDPDKIKELILQADESARQSAAENGHSIGIYAVQAHYTAKGAVNEATGGYTFLKFLHKFAKNFDSVFEEFLPLVHRAQKEAIVRHSLTVSVTGSNNIDLSDFLSGLPSGNERPESASYKTELPKRLGIRIPSQVGFAVTGYNLAQCNEKTSGSLRVAANIISLCYLWNCIRVQGGAYGAGLPVSRDGNIFFYSYRDPSPSRSLEVYKEASKFLEEFCTSGEDIDKFIISAVSSTEPLTTPAAKGLTADDFWFSEYTDDDRLSIRRQMLKTNREDLRACCEAFKKATQDGAIALIGRDETLNECEGLTVFEL